MKRFPPVCGWWYRLDSQANIFLADLLDYDVAFTPGY